jgi:uncharacterized delta-60 repeat protein
MLRLSILLLIFIFLPMARLFKFNNRVAYALITLILSLSLLLSTTPVFAIPGALDTSFNTDGLAIHTGAAGGNHDYAYAFYVNDDGEIFVAGSSRNTSYEHEMAAWKLDSNGDADTSFASDGSVTYIGAGGGDSDHAVGIVEDSQGRVVIVGDVQNANNSGYYTAVWRYTSAGALDTSFSGDGLFVSDSVAQTTIRPYDVVVDGDDKIYALVKYTGGMSIWKFNTNGTLDTSFDSDGIMVSKGLGTTEAYGYDIEIDSEDRLVVGGRSYNTSQSRWEPTVWRVETDGSLDTSFSGNGVASYFVPSAADNYQWVSAVAIGTGDIIGAVGRAVYSGSGGDAFFLMFEEDGDLDTSFSSDGVALSGYTTSEKPWTQGFGVDFDENGNLVAVGRGYESGQMQYIHLWRFLSDGSLDEDFGTNGIALEETGSISGGGPAEKHSLMINSDGEILTAGSTIAAPNHQMTVWQFRGGEVDTIAVDVRPGECENLVDVDSTGVLTVAINGTSSFDVTDIDPDSVKLEDASPLQSFVQDMSYSGDCDEFADTYDDLIVRFRISDLPSSLQSLSSGQTADLDLTADYYTNGSISGTDTIEVIND